MNFSPQQSNALSEVATWLSSSTTDKPFFYLAGYAGTGKTTLAKHLVEGIEGEVLFAAYTGKAALQLQKSGCPNPTTIHQLIYRLREPSATAIAALEERIKATSDETEITEWKKELKELKKPQFVLNPESRLRDVELLVLDECSMVNEELASDLLSFSVPILVLGDPGQLPPVSGEGYFTGGTPDILLTEIHRQAKDNPIIALSMFIRENGYVPWNFSSQAGLFPTTKLKESSILAASQIICGKNTTRRYRNQQVRKLMGLSGMYPQAHEKLICLRNNRKVGIFNGLFAEVKEVNTNTSEPIEDYRIECELLTELGQELTLPLISLYFEEYEIPKILETLPFYVGKQNEHFDYGYAITVHKSQGSQFDKLLVIDDGMFNWGRKYAEARTRWLYTAVTRAVESVFMVKSSI